MSLAEHSEVWPEVELGEVCEFAYGKSLPAKSRTGSGYPVYGSNGPVGLHEEALTAGETIVIGRKGSFGEVHYSPGPCSPIDTTYYITQEQTKAYLPWLARRLRCLDLDQLNRAAAIPGLNRADAYRQTLLRPPLDQQKRIAGILDAADALRAKRREALAQLDTLLQSTFLDMFGDPVTNPMGWDTSALGEVGEVITGNTPSRKHPEYYGEDIEWIKSDNINDPSFVLTEAEERLSVAGKAVARTSPRGSILVTCIAGSPSCIGNAAIADREVAFNQQINAFVPGERIALWFAFGMFWVGKRLVQSASTSSMKGMVSKSAFSAISIPIPPTSLQSRFDAIGESVEHQKASQRAHLAELDTLFTSLQSRAFRGDL